MKMTIPKTKILNAFSKVLLVGLLISPALGCSDITDGNLPDGVIGPSTYNNRQGALRLTQATQNELASAIKNYIITSGSLTDELQTQASMYVKTDMRSGMTIQHPPHLVRSLARLARGVISKYVSGETSAWRAQLYMYEAYAEIITADGWCSGVPLSTLDFEADWTYKAGSTTDEIYKHAIQLLDSAENLAADSVTLKSAIRVLKARAQLGLGLYSEARQTVNNLSDDFRYEIRIAFDAGSLLGPTDKKYGDFFVVTVADREGINGLPYRSSNDPRTRSVLLSDFQGYQSYFPLKYVTTGDSSVFTLASAVEANLILAEVAFQESDSPKMFEILNFLRSDGSFSVDTSNLAAGGHVIDTIWSAGIGGVAELKPFEQLPLTSEAQRKLLFSERAAWLFLAGSRQGDLRRLVRKYGIRSEHVYPTGIYTGPNAEVVGAYGTEISFGLSQDEFRNPLFKGCQYDD